MKILSILILTLALSGSAQAGVVHLAARGGKSVAKVSFKAVKGLGHVTKKVLW